MEDKRFFEDGKSVTFYRICSILSFYKFDFVISIGYYNGC